MRAGRPASFIELPREPKTQAGITRSGEAASQQAANDSQGLAADWTKRRCGVESEESTSGMTIATTGALTSTPPPEASFQSGIRESDAGLPDGGKFLHLSSGIFPIALALRRWIHPLCCEVTAFLIVAALMVLLIGGALFSAWLAPEGEETPEGFRVVGPSRFQHFRDRVSRRFRRVSRVGDLTHDQHH